MASRRAPLANVPNAVNSPFVGKRTRTQLGDTREATYGQPPTKKQIIDVSEYYPDDENADPKRRKGVSLIAIDKSEEPFALRRAHNAPPTALEKKLASVRERRTVPAQRDSRTVAEAHADNVKDNVISVRQWQKHYRRQFPQFVFYFDGVADDARSRTMRSIQTLGAREEKFFSKAVTHVVTTRAIPTESSDNNSITAHFGDAKNDAPMTKTIHPSVLTQDPKKSTALLDAHLQRRSQSIAASQTFGLENRKLQPPTTDILSRARTLGIKIWALEKLYRVLGAIFDDTAENIASTQQRGYTTTARPAQDADLEQLLRHEKVNGPADRDMTVATQDMATLRGSFIYVHDMDEKTKPVMVREYEKPATKEQGKWPQFRITPIGRCPFVEDTAHTKKLQQQAKDSQATGKAEREIAQRKTRATVATTERESTLRRSPRKLSIADDGMNQPQPREPPHPEGVQRHSSMEGMSPLFGSTQATLRGMPRLVRGEPVASGIQPSNVTSAIRSQAISSAAISSTAPGLNRRMGDTKEVSMLKRKILEKGNNVTSNHSIPSSYMNDVRAAINDDNGPPPRAAKRKAQETLGVVHEHEETRNNSRTKSKPAASKKKKTEKEAKPGYCENCRDKFDDFDVHVLSRKHRKFALSSDNWKDLDSLLLLLKRPHKQS